MSTEFTSYVAIGNASVCFNCGNSFYASKGDVIMRRPNPEYRFCWQWLCQACTVLNGQARPKPVKTYTLRDGIEDSVNRYMSNLMDSNGVTSAYAESEIRYLVKEALDLWRGPYERQEVEKAHATLYNRNQSDWHIKLKNPALIDPNAKIEMLKAYRELTGKGLKESKDALDACKFDLVKALKEAGITIDAVH